MIDVYLNAISGARGSRVETNDAATLGQPIADCERIVRKTGVHSRPVAAPDEYTSDLAEAAIRNLMRDANIDATEVDTLLVCTQTPDHLIPGVSSQLHGRLGLPRDCFALDINQGCSGFTVGTQLASAMVRSPRRNAILVNADTYSRLIRSNDLATRVLFGDAAAASLFSPRRHGLCVMYARNFSDGTGYNLFVARGSAVRRGEGTADGIHMDGPGILNFALRVVPEAIAHALRDNGLRMEQIRMVLFHQANHFVIGQLANKLKLGAEQVPENCAELGNTVSASIPLLLQENLHMLRHGEFVLAVGFGVGLSWGVNLFECVGHA
jgi:3-oxoacyl-[acyl-carrier-protein] synthase-3